MQNIEDHVLAELKPKNRRGAGNTYDPHKMKAHFTFCQTLCMI